MGCAHQLQRMVYLPAVLSGQDAQPPGVGVASGRNKVKAGGQLGAAAVRSHQSHAAGTLAAGAAGQRRAVQQHCAAQRLQLPRQRFEQGGFACTVGADEGKDLPGLYAQRNIVQKHFFVVADGKAAGPAQNIFVHRAPS